MTLQLRYDIITALEISRMTSSHVTTPLSPSVFVAKQHFLHPGVYYYYTGKQTERRILGCD